MAHSFKASMLKRVCNMDWAHRLSNTACFDRDIWEFFAVLCTVHVDQRLCRPPDPVASTDSGRGRGFVADGSDIQRNIPPLDTHLILKFWKEKKGKENQTDKRKLKNMGGNVKKKIYIYSRLTWKGCKYILFYYCYKENVIKKDPIGWCCTSLWTQSGLDNIYTRVIQHIRHWLSNEEWVTVCGDGKIATQYEFLIVSCFERIKFIY